MTNKESRIAIGVVSVLLIVSLLAVWSLKDSQQTSSSDISSMETPSEIAPEGSGQAVENSSSGSVVRDEAVAGEAAELAPSSESTITNGENELPRAGVDDETFRIIVLEPVMVDGVDVGKTLEGKVITADDEIVYKAKEN